MRSSGLRDMGILLLGAGIGAGLTLVLEPRGGAYRRAVARDKIVHWSRQGAIRVSKATRNASNRVRGNIIEFIKSNEQVDDDVLKDRVRAQVGHMVQSETGIDIYTSNGEVKLVGAVRAGEKERIWKRLAKTRGVCSCDLSGLQEGEHGVRQQSARVRTGS